MHNQHPPRHQLTLFLSSSEAVTIEKLRQQYSPVQSQLINCHVTLCREDEIEKMEKVLANLNNLSQPKIVIEFGAVTRFDNGKGLLMPALKNVAFQNLRKHILRGIIDEPREQEPHITLMHPRNSTCTDAIFSQVEKITVPTKFTFKTISLIEQKDGGPWKVLQEFELGAGLNRIY